MDENDETGSRRLWISTDASKERDIGLDLEVELLVRVA
jgi:hypothetical protein